ncbi:Uncharacterized conserved protein YdhG, YjbR/CyaY-like superfamily, DUF1801 family [Catalinimonas alkaloidigena]|uniref:Uncharacterized conserved protein YdhG, YjbR/CyaY-like superfamily, DUF1801 family n=1 Tax=Catalinimonas alkaloidigena TaxID=1075417 RepID=A0A1G9RLR9_9BACT|nr:DUF1801 domain-containing protein [Catalinimonas alkaloidigena]SDM24071.1 Uncharacterized conserved protein YdhG, YjbR/CyaY-like superfamily, DUF1801 family [Catalinimonas alkaloidigena]
MQTSAATSVDAYISGFSDELRQRLTAIRTVVQQVAPEAQEIIKYQMPTFVWHGNLVHFAAFKHHIGFYPVPSAIDAFQEELVGYKRAKGTVQFPHDQPLPLDLIRRMVAFRVQENQAKAAQKAKKGTV